MSLFMWVGLPCSVVAGFQEQVSQESQAEAVLHSSFEDNTITLTILCWWRQSQRATQAQRESI